MNCTTAERSTDVGGGGTLVRPDGRQDASILSAAPGEAPPTVQTHDAASSGMATTTAPMLIAAVCLALAWSLRRAKGRLLSRRGSDAGVGAQPLVMAVAVETTVQPVLAHAVWEEEEG